MPDRAATERKVAEQARRAVMQALRADREDRELGRRFSIDKFGRHRDGYLHARVIIDGTRRAYFTVQFGSWMAPGSEGRLKEPEALLGTELGRAVKYALAAQAQRFRPTITEEDEDDGNGHSDESEAAGRAGEAVPAAGLSEGGDHGSATE